MIMFTKRKRQPVHGFTLVEVLTVLVIASMIIMVVVGIYTRVRDASASVSRELDTLTRPVLIAQRIAEDIDRLAGPGVDTSLTIENRFDGDFTVSRMVIETRIVDKEDQPIVYERVTWQTAYDMNTDSLVLYRAHGGINLEDKLIDAQIEVLAEKEVELFVPVVSGLTYFTFQVPTQTTMGTGGNTPDGMIDDFDVGGPGVTYLDEWTQDKLPTGVTVTLSFLEPQVDVFGQAFFEPEDLYQRTIAVDRTRLIPFKFVKKVYKLPEIDLEDEEEDETVDPNDLDEEDREEFDEEMQRP